MPSDFLELHGFNGFHASSGVPHAAVEKLKERQDTKTTELKSIAFTPDGDWVLLFGGNGIWTSNSNLPAVKKLSGLWKDPHADFKCVAFAPSGGWAVLWGQNGYWTEGGIPKDAVKRIAEVAQSGGALRSIALGARRRLGPALRQGRRRLWRHSPRPRQGPERCDQEPPLRPLRRLRARAAIGFA